VIVGSLLLILVAVGLLVGGVLSGSNAFIILSIVVVAVAAIVLVTGVRNSPTTGFPFDQDDDEPDAFQRLRGTIMGGDRVFPVRQPDRRFSSGSDLRDSGSGLRDSGSAEMGARDGGVSVEDPPDQERAQVNQGDVKVARTENSSGENLAASNAADADLANSAFAGSDSAFAGSGVAGSDSAVAGSDSGVAGSGVAGSGVADAGSGFAGSAATDFAGVETVPAYRDEDVEPIGGGTAAGRHIVGDQVVDPSAPIEDSAFDDNASPGASAGAPAHLSSDDSASSDEGAAYDEGASFDDADLDEDPPDEPSAQQVSPANAARVAMLSSEVLVVDGRPRYHAVGCVHLLGRETEPLPVGEAIELGFTPCGLCEPDTSLLDELAGPPPKIGS
jgi:hypothetical protein